MNDKKKLRYKTIRGPLTGLGIKENATPLGQVLQKNSLSLFDYIIILSTMYGVGTAIGIIAGTSQNILPARNEKPIVFAACVGLLLLGANRGWATAKRTDEVKKLLSDVDYDTIKDQVADIQKQVSDYVRS